MIRQLQSWPNLPHRIALAASCLLVLLTTFFAFSFANDFPLHYHPDEFSKVEQVIDPYKGRNFHHPLLLVELTDQVRSIAFPRERRFQEVAQIGRSISAALGAVVVLALALAAYLRLGWIGFWTTAASLLLCQALLVHAHYLKEDVAMAAGIALTILAIALLARKNGTPPSTPQFYTGLIIAALGVAIAAGAKYVGIVTLIPVLLAIALTRSGWKTAIYIPLVLALAVGSWVAINGRMFTSFVPPRLNPEAIESGQGELQDVTHGRDITLKRPNAYVLHRAATTTPWPLWLFLAGGAYLFIRQKDRTHQWYLPLTLLVLLIIIVLSQTALPFSRYALPVALLIAFLAALSSATLIQASRNKVWLAVAVAALLVSLTIQAHRCWAVTQGFQLDSRQQLRAWMATHALPLTGIAADNYTNLGLNGDHRYPDIHLPLLRLRTFKYAASAAPTVKDLAKRGAKFVVIASPAYDRFFATGLDLRNDSESTQRRAFYSDLFQLGQVAWESPTLQGETGYTSPKITVFDISKLAK